MHAENSTVPGSLGWRGSNGTSSASERSAWTGTTSTGSSSDGAAEAHGTATTDSTAARSTTAVGNSLSSICSAGVYDFFSLLHSLQQGTQFPRVDLPPRDTGITWSSVRFSAPTCLWQ